MGSHPGFAKAIRQLKLETVDLEMGAFQRRNKPIAPTFQNKLIGSGPLPYPGGPSRCDNNRCFLIAAIVQGGQGPGRPLGPLTD
eukprot:12747648-Alexandrium_andersonii.AAC.1